MNKIYKVIWSKVRNCYVAVSEIAKRNGKSCTSVNCGAKANRGHAGVALSAAVGATLLAGMCSVLLPARVALAAPVMPTLDVNGKSAAVTIASTSSATSATMNINSTQMNNVLKWIDFSIEQGGTVQFDPNNYLNYVTGHGRSKIDGILKQTKNSGGQRGSIYIVNPNGVLFGDNARVDVGSLYVSTRDISDKLSDFGTAVGALFPATYDNAAVGDVINLGKLNADVIQVEGKNISFKNIADVTKGGALTDGDITGGTAHHKANDGSVTLTVNNVTNNKGEIHLGFAVSDTPVEEVNSTQYTNVAEPTLTGWTANVTPTKYMLVRNAYELQNMQNKKTLTSQTNHGNTDYYYYYNIDGNYMLANDIEFEGTSFNDVNSAPNTGFRPIGYTADYTDSSTGIRTNTDYYFSGKFDGLNFTISNLKITGVTLPSDVDRNIGLFGINRGTIENVGVVNTHIDVSNMTGIGQCIGGVVGWNYNGGIIRNVYHTGSVKGKRSLVGGIVGQNYGSSIENSYNTGDVDTLNNTGIGGIAGGNSSRGKITNVYNTGDIGKNSDRSEVGGIVGTLGGGTIENAYNTGEVKGTSSVGGIVGYSVFNNTIKNTYNVGTVTKDTDLGGGILGFNNSQGSDTTIEASYFSKGDHDNVLSGTTYVENSDDMKKAGTFIAWNTTTPTISATGGAKTTWRIIEGQTTPQLTAFLKTKDYINKKPYDGTADFGENKNVGTYKNEKNENSKTIPVTTHQVDGLAQGFDYVQDISVIEPKELLLVADKISIKKDGTVPSNFTGRITGFAPGESLGAGDTLKFALTEGETPTAVGFYGVKGTLKIGESNPAESGTYGTNYTFTNDPANASAFSIVVGVMPKLDFKGASPYVTIASTPDTMNISSLQTNNVLKWMDFSIDKDGKVIFDTNNYLNYVTGHGRSEIDGTLTGGGNIYLINPNGMVFGSTAQVNVGNLYLSTRDLFTVNKLTDYETAVGALFQNDNAAIGDVTNLGKLNANGVVDSTTNTIEVEGKNISFKNIADVTKGGAITNGTLSGGSMHDNVKLTSHGGEIHLGFAVGEEVNTVNNTQYTNVTPPTLTGWTTDGTTYKYMLVRNAYELQNMKNILDGNYMLANDIEFKKTNGKYYITNFTPVGSYGNEPVDYLPYVFRGRLDGLNHVIKDIQIVKSGSNNYRTAYDVGIIGSNAGTVENLGVVNGSVDAKTNINGSWVGGIVGANKKEGTIRNVYFSGTVKGTNSVGGIAGGQNAGGIIENAYNKGEIIGYQTVGGIVGTNLGGVRSSDSSLFGTVRNTYNSGTVSASDLYSGGIAGQNAGNIENVYSDANASISGKSYVGGIVGRNYTYDTYTGKIVSAYNAGSVSGTGNYIGGIVGDGISGEVTNSYFSNGYYDENGVKQTKTQDLNLKSKNTFSLWGDDISAAGGAGTVWRIYDGQTTPLLTAFLKTKDVITETEYDGSLQPFDAELVTGDDHIISTVTGETGYAKQTNAGKYDGLAGGNVLYSDQLGYDLVDTKLIIQPKRLTVTFGSNTYNGIAVFTGVSGTLTGVVDGDVGKVSVTATATYVDKNVGEGKAVTYSNITLDGDKKDNYIVVDELTGTGAITKKELNATFDSITKEYDGNDTATENGKHLVGVVDGDTVNFADGITGQFITNTEQVGKNVGTNKDITYSGIDLTGADSSNYSIATTATGKGDITAKKLTVTFADISKTYDGTQEDRDSDGNAVESRTASGVDGVVAGETISVTGKATYSTPSADDENSQTVNYSGLTPTGTTASNYIVMVPEGGVTGSGKILRKELTVGEIVKEYDGTTDATLTVDNLLGVVEGDKPNLSISGVTANYTGDKAADYETNGKTVYYSGLILGGDKKDNYSIAASGTSTTGNSITKRVLTANSVSKVYDGTPDATLHLSDLVGTDGLPGVVERDESDLVLTTNSAAYASKNAGTGNVTFNGISLTGDKAHNYTINDSITVSGTITRKALELVAKEVTIHENDQMPPSSDFNHGSIIGFIAGEGLANNDKLVFSLADDSMTTPVVGSYRIVGTLNGDENGDYGLNYTFQNAASNATAFTVKPILAVLPALDFRGASVWAASVNVTIDKSKENKLLIDSTKLYNTLKWIDFSIGENGTVQFDDKNYLNYVTGHGRSDIDGTITGGGAIYLINPNGVLFGSTAQVNVGNLYVSSRTLDSTALNAFETNGTNPLSTTTDSAIGNIINRGKLKAAGITVEGNNVSFKNYADVTATGAEGIKVRADGEVHVGFSYGEEAAAVNDTEYKTVSDSEPELANWDFKKTDNTTEVTPEKYMLVRNAYELQNMKNNLLGNYMLANDIEFKNENGGYIIGQFIPIGSLGGWTDYKEGMFKGKLDGLYHVIRDIYIDNTAITQNSNRLTDIGIIGSNAGVVENLGVINGNVNITNSGASAVGGIVGANKPGGIIRNVYFSGSVKGGRTGTGGVAGWQNGGGLTENAYATGTVTSSYRDPDRINGVVGVIAGSIKNAYFSGIVGREINDKMNELYKSDGTRQTLTDPYSMKQVATFNSDGSDGAGWDITADGSKNATWRIYEGKTTPLLTAFLKTKSLVTETEYDGRKHSFDTTLVTGDSQVNELDGATYSAMEKIDAGVYDETKKFYSDSQQGYNIVDTKLVIQPKTLTLVNSKTYDGTTNTKGTIGFTGKIGNDNVSLVDGSVTGGIYADKNVGANKAVTYTIADSTLGGTNKANYILTVKGTGTITPKAITATFDDISKVYDGTINDVDENGAAVTSRTGTLTGVVLADTGKVSVTGKALYADKNAGTEKTVNYSNVALGGGETEDESGNYVLSSTSATGKGTITQREISVAFGNISKTYDGLTTSDTIGKRTFTNVVDADAEKVDVTATATYDKKDAGSRSVAYTGVTLTGAEAGNYSISDTGTGAGTITQREISVAFGDISKTYDGLTTSDTIGKRTFTNVVDADAEKVDVTATATYDKKDAGDRSVAYSGVTLTGAEAGNYSIADTGTGKGTITQREISVAFGNISKTYDGLTTSDTIGERTFTNVVEADANKVDVTATATYDKKDAGNRSVAYTGVTLTGAEAGNYSIADTGTGKGTITQREISVAFGNISKTYDGLTTSDTIGKRTFTNVVDADAEKVDVTATATYDKKDAGDRSVAYTTIALTGDEADNYSLANTTASSTGTIDKKSVTATFADISKIYDGTTNTAPGAGTLTGVIAADEGKVNVSATDASYDEKNAGSRTVNYTGVTLSGAEAGNYSIATTATGNGTIGRKALELVADPASTEYGDYNPASFTGRVDGFVTGESVSNGDTLLFALSDPSASAVGSYGITGTINGSSSGDYGLNYTFTNAASNANAFTIYARPASVQDMVLSDIIPGIKGKSGADISVTALDNAMEQARDKRAEVGIEFAIAQTILSVDADRNLSLENRGMKQPPAMTPQEVAEQVHAQQGKGNGVAAQAGGNAGAASGGTNENGAASNAGVTGAVNAAMDVVQQTDDAVGTEESKRKKGVA